MRVGIFLDKLLPGLAYLGSADARTRVSCVLKEVDDKQSLTPNTTNGSKSKRAGDGV